MSPAFGDDGDGALVFAIAGRRQQDKRGQGAEEGSAGTHRQPDYYGGRVERALTGGRLRLPRAEGWYRITCVSGNVIRGLIALGAAGLLAVAYNGTGTSSVMASAATAFLNSLTDEQRAKASFAFDNDERFFFHFVPGNNIQQSLNRQRLGLTLGEMQPYQRHLAMALLSSGLSQAGFIKATSIMSLEDVLRILEKDDGKRRDPLKYHFSVFGTPSDTSAWGFRVEGHHLSQNFVVKDGKLAGSPSFFGTNPAEVRIGPRKGLRVLGREEDLGRALFASLTAEQKKTALVQEKAFSDILTAASRKASIAGQPDGLSAAKMTAKQRGMLEAVVAVYAANMPPELQAHRMGQFKAAGANVYFAWAGGEKLGDPHYYRVAARKFLIEYDNTQNEANHVHSVWRDYTGDFGGDLLARHYQESHTQVARR